jgi:hypothetical protein
MGFSRREIKVLRRLFGLHGSPYYSTNQKPYEPVFPTGPI